jgi:hypothetical protein
VIIDKSLALSPISSKTKLTEEDYLHIYRKTQVDEFLKSKNIQPRFKQTVLVESNPINLNLISPKGIQSTITDIKVTRNKEIIRKEFPKLLNELKQKVVNENPKVLIKNKYKLFLDNYHIK